MSKSDNQSTTNQHVVLIGAGIMSATLGMLIKELEPDWTIDIFERLDVAAAESSDAWNNAGTGHSAFCELNYTPEGEDGSIKSNKAIKIAENFEESKQFWAYMVENQILSLPGSFIRRIPHMSFVWGDENVEYLRKRFEALKESHLFDEMEYTEDPKQIMEWVPLVMEGRDETQKVAATKVDIGTDVNFGSLTKGMFKRLKEMKGVQEYFNHEVRNLNQGEDGRWEIKVKDIDNRKKRKLFADFVFIGAGGGSLPLLLKSGIPESKGYGGFPVSGQWLKCTNTEIIERHNAKVYGKASVGSPPMSVPHLDTRWIKGKRELLFGPYAGFTTKFLKQGSSMDLFKSVKLANITPMLSAGIQNLPLTKYLIDQVRQSPEDRLDSLKEYLPGARMEDWELEIAGQRVQVIKKDPEGGGVLEFGTEVVSAADGSIAALLGASPGASTAVSIMLSLLKRCFPDKINTEAWQNKIRQMIPTYGKPLGQDEQLCQKTREWTGRVLGLVPEMAMKQ